MRSETFTHDTITATVCSRTRRAAIIQAQYRQVLQRVHPEIVEYEQAVYQFASPQRPDLGEKLTEKQREQRLAIYNAQYTEYIAKVTATRAKYPVGAAYADASSGVVALIGRISQINNAVFHVGEAGLIPDAQVIQAFDDYLNDDGDLTGFWTMLAAAIAKIDAPLTGTEAKPPNTLSEAETDSPLSSGTADSSNSS